MATKIKWEIRCANSKAEAEALAADGWELTSVNEGGDWVHWWFKREATK